MKGSWSFLLYYLLFIIGFIKSNCWYEYIVFFIIKWRVFQSSFLLSSSSSSLSFGFVHYTFSTCSQFFMRTSHTSHSHRPTSFSLRFSFSSFSTPPTVYTSKWESSLTLVWADREIYQVWAWIKSVVSVFVFIQGFPKRSGTG